MKLYVVRHGETTYNEQDRVCGVSDAPLTERGREQARALAESIGKLHIDRVFVSPLARARETAELALSGTGLCAAVEPRLIEEDFGACEGVPRKDPVFQYAKRNIGVRQPGGESFIRLCHRVYSLIEELGRTYPDENILLVCHGTLGRAVRTYFVDMSNDEIYSYNMGNCEIVEYDYPSGCPKIT
jgi:probable phosphoglycerate mutase